MKHFLIFGCAMLMLASCSKTEDSSPVADEEAFAKTKAARAVMIYMAAENNLSASEPFYRTGGPFMQTDLKEIVEGSKSLAANQRVFVFVDSIVTDQTKKSAPYIAEVHGGKVYPRYQFESDFYSSSPARFREVLGWMTGNISADGYGLVLWGHADGWIVESDSITDTDYRTSRRAYGRDDGKNTGGSTKWMNITQMARAMATLPKLDFIFADCCNMMCAEVGYELRNVTSYLIGSPAEIPGPGAPYDKMLPQFFKNGSSLYGGIIDTYYNYYTEYLRNPSLGDSYAKGYSVPLSVIDTRYMEQLATATRSALDQFTGGYPQSPASPATDDIAYYWGYETPVMYDMRAVLKTSMPADAFQQWDRIYSQAVPYYRMSMRWLTIYNGYPYYNLQGDFAKFNQDTTLYGCVSMMFPKDNNYYNAGEYKYNKTCRNFEWNRVIDWTRYGWE